MCNTFAASATLNTTGCDCPVASRIASQMNACVIIVECLLSHRNAGAQFPVNESRSHPSFLLLGKYKDCAEYIPA